MEVPLVLKRDREYSLCHIDAETGFGLLYSRRDRDTVFLNPLAVAVWRAEEESIDPEGAARLFADVTALPGAEAYARTVFTQLEARGILLPCDGHAKPRPKAVDRYPLEQVYFYVTRECNAHCYHCYQPVRTVGTTASRPLQSDQISKDTFLGFLRAAVPLGLRAVKLTGGEPLLREDLPDIIRGIREYGLQASIETNGVLLSEATADLLAANKVSVSVSLDGGSAELHDRLRGLKGAFAGAIRALRLLVARGCDPTVIMAISRKNIHEVDDVLAVAHANGCRRVKFNPVNRLGIAARLKGDAVLLDVQDIIGLYRRRRELESRHGVFLFLEGPPSFASVSEIVGGHAAVCPFVRILGILADGSISYCGIGNSCPELVLGNITDAGFDLAKFWTTAPPLVHAREMVAAGAGGVCARCILEPYCKGSCRALAYSEGGSFSSPHPFCEEAMQRGIFPTYYLRADNESTATTT